MLRFLGTDRISAVAVDASHVFVTGTFSSIAGTSANDVAKWDGERWWSLSDGRGGGITQGQG
ncbi:MAG: hypothetical protein U0641_12635 [Anaerolineae bacterium]